MDNRLNYLALIALHPKTLSELSTKKIIKVFVQANPKKLAGTEETVGIGSRVEAS